MIFMQIVSVFWKLHTIEQQYYNKYYIKWRRKYQRPIIFTIFIRYKKNIDKEIRFSFIARLTLNYIFTFLEYVVY